jgi:hypothetical protein
MHIARYEFFISANFPVDVKRKQRQRYFNIHFYLIFSPGVMNARYEFFDFFSTHANNLPIHPSNLKNPIMWKQFFP